MAGIRLEFAQFGDFDSFDIIRSTSSMASTADADLPSPVVTGLKTMYWVDPSVIEGKTYYYKVRVWRDGIAKVSNELRANADYDPYYSNVISLLNFKNNFNDPKGNIWNAVSSPQIVTHLGEDALYLNGNSAIYTDLNLSGINDLTIEVFASLINGGHGSSWSRIMHIGSGNQQGAFDIVCGFNFDNPSHVGASIWEGYSTGEKSIWNPNTIQNDVIHHIAVTLKNGNFWNLFIDGTNIGSFTSSQQLIRTRVNIGYNGNGSEYFYGHIHGLRITKDLVRYNNDFTPPNHPFPVV